MSIFGNIKRILGVDNDPDLYGDDVAEQAVATGETRQSEVAAEAVAVEMDGEHVSAILDSVVAVFNASLPGFIADSIDGEKQRKSLYERLDASLKSYLTQAEADARRRGLEQITREHEGMKAEIDRMQRYAKDLESKRTELKERQLSADRQKRALSERVHDLETQVMKLEAEKEQFDLENKSLLNKAKVAQVYEKEIEELNATIADLQAGKPVTKPEDAAKIEEQKAEIERLSTALEAAEVKMGMQEEMVKDWQHRAGESASELKTVQERIAELEEQLKEEQARNDENDREDAITDAEIEQIRQQIEAFDAVRQKLDARIAQLKEQLKASQAECESLRNTVKNNLMQHAVQEKALREELDALRDAMQRNPQPSDQSNNTGRQRSRAEADTTDVEDIISDTDWLVGSTKKDDDFGYTPPRRSQPPINPAQPNLFDF